jgi:hypothetical protein
MEVSGRPAGKSAAAGGVKITGSEYNKPEVFTWEAKRQATQVVERASEDATGEEEN